MIHKKIFLVIIIVLLICGLYSLYQQAYLNQKTQKILSLFQQYALVYDIDKKSIDPKKEIPDNLPTGFENLQKKIVACVHTNKPLLLTMVGFPYKSANTIDKVLLSSIDGAERYSLEYLQNFLDKIKNYYSPGAKLIIFTDGIIFCDIEKISDEMVIEYENNLKILTQDLPDIKIITMRDLCSEKSPHKIRKLITAISPSYEEFNIMLKTDTKLQNDIDTLTKRMAFELALLSLSNKELTAIALQETHRSMQYSNFLKQFRPDTSITCSVHYQNDVSRKFGLKISDSFITPWHGILIVSKNKKTIVHLKDIDLSLYKKINTSVNGLPVAYLAPIKLTTKTPFCP